MNIGLIHFRVGETDGVSLEMEKWKLILEQLGHKVWYVAGSGDVEDMIVVNELHYQHSTNELLVDHIYKRKEDGRSEAEIKELLADYTAATEKSLLKAIEDYKLDIIVPNNVLSLGWNLAAGQAVCNIIEKTDIKVTAHHHDFHWERELYSHPKYQWVTDILEEHFPPTNPKVNHVVINNIAQSEMKARLDLEATIVPNVFDYEHEFMKVDAYNENIRQELGLKESDIILLQATRIVARKGIELIIRAMEHMNAWLPLLKGRTLYDGRIIDDSTRIKLVMVGLNEEDSYFKKLEALAKDCDVDLIYAGDRFDFERREEKDQKIFSLWDAYQLADVVSYPSLLEGFGNQFLEATYAKKPLMVYEYPVYVSYLSQFGFKVTSYGYEHELDENGLAMVEDVKAKFAADDMLKVLTDARNYQQTVDKNYEICLKEFSYGRLKELLVDLF